MKNTTLIFIAALLTVLQSCSFLHDDVVVAFAAGEKLHRKDVAKQIPPGLSPADSTAMAEDIVKSWVLSRIVEKKAEQQLSDSDKDVGRELEEYKNALLRYRFEQKFIESHLDTTVTHQQILEHYEANKATYTLSVPIVKARSFRLPQKSRERDAICTLLKSGGEDDVAELYELGQRPACAYSDFGGRWLNVVDLARSFGMDYGSFLAKKDKDSFVVILDEQSEENLIYLAEQIGFGKTPPVEYCEKDIKELIVSRRRYELSKNLEKELLEEAARNGEFEIYETEE